MGYDYNIAEVTLSKQENKFSHDILFFSFFLKNEVLYDDRY